MLNIIKMLQVYTLRRQLHRIFRQGNNKDIQEFFNEILLAAKLEFTEDNSATIACFLVENIYNSFMPVSIDKRKWIKNAMIKELEENYKRSCDSDIIVGLTKS